MRSQQSCCRRRPQCTRPAFAAGHGQGILITFLIYPLNAHGPSSPPLALWTPQCVGALPMSLRIASTYIRAATPRAPPPATLPMTPTMSWTCAFL